MEERFGSVDDHAAWVQVAGGQWQAVAKGHGEVNGSWREGNHRTACSEQQWQLASSNMAVAEKQGRTR